MTERNEQSTQNNPVTSADRLAANLAKLRQARSNLTDQDLIAERLKKRKEALLMSIKQARQKVHELEATLNDESAHREIVERILLEELRLAEFPFIIALYQGTLIGPRPKPEE